MRTIQSFSAVACHISQKGAVASGFWKSYPLCRLLIDSIKFVFLVKIEYPISVTIFYRQRAKVVM